ncbi:hypothetical protein RB653_011169 (mitochondrion) [Dictyostelium firmibasis]|uniref:Mp26-like protein n=1 Tax=Dictyostelium firmibasis TaxID=79012 RepID=A0AAN7TRM0_9MYCE
MGHIVNPNIYRLGNIVPWVSSGFKRKKNERSKIANEDFLIYNFTRNFFYKRVYKKVVGKIKKIQLKVKNRRRARKSKKKRKFGKTSLLNHWIIKYSHLTITRFNKTFQLNLFFFDRELQKRYRLRYKRSMHKIQKAKQRKKLKKVRILKRQLAQKIREQKGLTQMYLTTPVTFKTPGIIGQQEGYVPTLGDLSRSMALNVSSIIKPTRMEHVNYSLARDIRKKGQQQERIYIYKDNTFESNKVTDRIPLTTIEVANENYKNLYSKKLLKKIFKLKIFKFTKLVANFKYPKEYHYIDSLYFKTQARLANNYLFAKGKGNHDLKYVNKKKYIETIRKSQTGGIQLREKKAVLNPENIVDMVIDRYENKAESDKYKNRVTQLKRKEIVGILKQNELWKKHYLRLKIKRKKKKMRKKVRKFRHRFPHKYARNIKEKEGKQ